MMGEINKTDKLDVRGLNQLQRTGTLPTVWIPPGELRDQRDLPRTRMVLVRQRTQLKNRLHATRGHLLKQVEDLGDQIREFEQRIHTTFKPTAGIQHLMTEPGVGLMLAVV